MRYTPSPFPLAGAPSEDFLLELARYVVGELSRLSLLLNEIEVSGVSFVELHAAPNRVYTGLTVLADGSDWDPGSGQGVYTYYNGSWNKLG